MPARSSRRWTAAEVRKLQDASRAWPRYELIAGELVVTPAPALVHQLVVLELARILGDFCDREGVGLVLTSPADLELAPETISQPDVFVVPLELLPDDVGGAPDWRAVTALHLAIEVISPSSVRFDRVDKREHYLDANVAEYWVVDVEGRAIERWRKGRDTPAVERGMLEWRPAAWAHEPTAAGRRALSIDVQRFFELIARKLRRPREGER